MYTVNIPANVLAATLHTMPKKDVRFYINGAYLDFPKGRIVSTDGHCLFCGQIEKSDCPPVILPRTAVEDALKLIGKKNIYRYQFTLEIVRENGDESPRTVRIAAPGAVIGCTEIEGRYPEYERVIPLITSGEVAQFDPDILASCRDAINSYTGNSLIGYALEHNGGNAALMLGKYCLAVAMPARLDVDNDCNWFTGKTDEPAEIAA